MPVSEKLSGSESLESLQEFIRGQSDNSIVPQRRINPDQLQKKINHFSSLQDLKNQNKVAESDNNGIKLSKKSSILDGAVNITGRPTIQSLKKFLNEQNLRVKTKAEMQQRAHPYPDRPSVPVPVQSPSTYVPQNTFKYKPFLKVRKRGEAPASGRISR